MFAAANMPAADFAYHQIMRLYESPGTLKRYRRTAWEFQQTFQTPLKELERFVDAIMAGRPRSETAMAVFEQVVFEPRSGLVPLYARYSLPPKWYGDDLTIEAQSGIEARELLEAVLSEWIDFLFVPTPTPFVIYADHDEYITFLAHRKAQLNGVVQELIAAKFRAVDYVRKL